MGIIEEVLAETELSNWETVQIEYNEGGPIHLHMDDLRLDFSVDEFETFAKAISEGKNDLEEVKDGV